MEASGPEYMVNPLDYCQQWIMAAVKKGDDLYTWEHIVQGLASGHMQLWPSENACIVTEIVVYPNKKALHVFLAGGKMDEILQMTENVKEWAQQHGCTFATFSGRLGWQKVLTKAGWKPRTINMQLEF